MRTIVELTDAQLEALKVFCDREGISRAEGVRRAVADLLDRDRRQQLGAFGLWRDAPVDGVAHQRQLRREWE
ncbi:MAG: ribbon-helix-helix protein, CopG family [Vicinamibacterales bacterium]